MILVGELERLPNVSNVSFFSSADIDELMVVSSTTYFHNDTTMLGTLNTSLI